MGLHLAWPDAEITGVDLHQQPRYPFRFEQGDALRARIEGADFVWASPPCQHWTAGRRTARMNGDNPYPDLIAATRALLRDWGGPYVIENVAGAPLIDPVMLCGEMFGLRVIRHRYFESNVPLQDHFHPKHKPGGLLDGSYIAVYGGKWLVGGQAGIKGRIPLEFTRAQAKRDAMGIHWTTIAELEQAIPPAYSEWLARQIR